MVDSTTAPRRRKIVAIGVVVLVLVVSFSSFIVLNSQNSYYGDMESVNLGVYPSEYCSLIYIANDQRYFEANGLRITLKDYPSGAAAVGGMLRGDVDIATASEFVIVREAVQNASLYAFGSVCKYLNLYVVARTDKGISSVSDLEGKTIGVSLGTGIQFYLGRYLELNGLKQSQVNLVNISFSEAPNALANGTLDAVITFQPYIDQIGSLLGNRVLVLPAQAEQSGYFEATCTRGWAANNPDLIMRFLKALVEAETFSIYHKDQAIAIVTQNLNYTNTYTASVWPEYQFSVTMDQSFVLLLQDEARWLISNNLVNTTDIPRFIDYLYVDGLKSVKPGSVNVIG